MNASERETTVTYADGDSEVKIYSCIRKDITAMKKKPQFTLVEEGFHTGKVLFAHFTVPREEYDVARGAKTRRNLSPEARAALGERFARSRAAAAEAEEEEDDE